MSRCIIPTPGQTEQEYLATHLMEQGLALCASQDELELLPLLQLADSFPYQTAAFDTQGLMQATVDRMLTKVRERKAAESSSPTSHP